MVNHGYITNNNSIGNGQLEWSGQPKAINLPWIGMGAKKNPTKSWFWGWFIIGFPISWGDDHGITGYFWMESWWTIWLLNLWEISKLARFQTGKTQQGKSPQLDHPITAVGLGPGGWFDAFRGKEFMAVEKMNGAVVGDSGRWWESVCFYFTPGCLQCWHSL